MWRTSSAFNGTVAPPEELVVQRYEVPEDATILRTFVTFGAATVVNSGVGQATASVMAILGGIASNFDVARAAITPDPGFPRLNIASPLVLTDARWPFHQFAALVPAGADATAVQLRSTHGQTLDWDSRSKVRLDSNHNFFYIIVTGNGEYRFTIQSRILLMIP